jgi:hypothetical protein
MRMSQQIIGWACAVGVGACTDRAPTAEMQARLDVAIDAHLVQVNVWLTHGGNEFGPMHYPIEPDEHVRVGFRGTELDLLFLDNAAQYDAAPYIVRFGVADDVGADEPIRVVFDRGDESVTLTALPPAPFTLAIPESSPANQDFVLAWSPTSGDRMRWVAFGCTLDFGADGPIPVDTGTLTFPYGVLSNGSDCTVDLRVERTHAGPVDTAFASTYVSGMQRRTGLVRFVP